MNDLSDTEHPFHYVSNFEDLIATSFYGAMNAICWTRTLTGDFAEIVNKVALTDNMAVLEKEQLCALVLSERGQLARETLLHDLKLLKAHGASKLLCRRGG